MPNYEIHKAAMTGYRRMTASYLDLFDELLSRRDEIVASRRALTAELMNRIPW